MTSTPPSRETTPGQRPARRGQPVVEKISPWPFVGMAGMACTFFLNAASGLLAPWYGVVVLMVLWFALLLLGFRWWSSHPGRMLVLPVVSLAVWFGVLMAGDLWLDWTA